MMYLLYGNYNISLKNVLKTEIFVCCMLLVSLVESCCLLTVITTIGRSEACLRSSCLHLQTIPQTLLNNKILNMINNAFVRCDGHLRCEGKHFQCLL